MIWGGNGNIPKGKGAADSGIDVTGLKARKELRRKVKTAARFGSRFEVVRGDV